MKKVILASLICLPFTSLAASDNTIQFRGEVNDQTCSVSVNGAKANSTVLLPTVSTSALSTQGIKAGLTKFTISLSGCTINDTETAQNIGTVFIANNLTSNNRIGNTGSAGDVSLELVDPKNPGTALDVTGATAAPGLSLEPNQTSASYDFAVQYYAENQTTAGSVLGSVQYAISYR